MLMLSWWPDPNSIAHLLIRPPPPPHVHLVCLNSSTVPPLALPPAQCDDGGDVDPLILASDAVPSLPYITLSLVLWLLLGGIPFLPFRCFKPCLTCCQTPGSELCSPTLEPRPHCISIPSLGMETPEPLMNCWPATVQKEEGEEGAGGPLMGCVR